MSDDLTLLSPKDGVCSGSCCISLRRDFLKKDLSKKRGFGKGDMVLYCLVQTNIFVAGHMVNL